MKNKTFYKEFLRTIKNTKARFLSIFIIIALGVGFFAGINATEPDMIISADNFYKENKLSDLTIRFPLELVKEDKTDILVIDGVSTVEEKTIKDVLIKEKGNSSEILRVYSLNENTVLDKPYVIEGKEPENKNQILLDASFQNNNKVKLGDKVELFLEDEKDFRDTLYSKEYEISGFALSPKYVSFERGQTNIGSGSVSYFGYLHEDAFRIESNNLLVAIKKTEGLGAYSDEYNNRLDFVEENIKNMGLSSMTSKERELVETLEEKEEELEEGRKQADKEFDQAQDQIEKAEEELIKGAEELGQAKEDFASKYGEGLVEVEKAEKELEDGKLEIEKNKILLEDGKLQLDEGEEELRKAERELNEAKSQLDNGERLLKDGADQLASGKESLETFKGIREELLGDTREGYKLFESEQDYERFLATIGIFSKQLRDRIRENVSYDDLDVLGKINTYIDIYMLEAETELNEGQKEYDKSKAEFAKGKKEYEEGLAKYNAGKREFEKQKEAYNDGLLELKLGEFKVEEGARGLTQGKLELEEGKKQFEETIAKEEEKLEEGQKELEESKSLLLEEKEEVYKEIEDGQKEIEDAYKDLKDIPDNWIITSRENYPGYSSYGDDARRMGAVAKVFPLFFFLVSALVSLTTMTRMVEEERTQIGTLKALGYKTSQIAVKYILYAFLASFFGSILGFSVGFKLFPKVIMIVYGGMYSIPNHVTPFHLKYAIISTLLAIITTVSATVFAIASEMEAMPAILMQAKAPKPGKRIFLERINFIWTRLSFLNKVTARNVFRYKRRLLMTVLGIAGSMALLLTGFGIRDSVNTINEKQFKEIFYYDGLVFIDEDEDLEKIKTGLRQVDEIKDLEEITSENISINSKAGNIEANIMVAQNADNFKNFIDLHKRQDKQELNIKDGVIITEKLASLIGKTVGDQVVYEDKDDQEFEFQIAGIAENYLAHYIYMDSDAYKEITKKETRVNSFMFNYSEDEIDSDFDENKFKGVLLNIEGVQGSLTTAYLEDQFEEGLKSLDYVVLILIISAGALSFIVLYNLTNINITERIKEIATIKVLGFRDGEVSAYIYKENIILSILGTSLGVVLGIVLHRFVMVTMEIDSMMFGKNIYPLSYLYSSVLSLSFTLVVNLAMHFRLKKVDMVESLK